MLLWLSVPIGIILACVAHRFSIVEGCAGDAGYDGLETSDENNGHD